MRPLILLALLGTAAHADDDPAQPVPVAMRASLDGRIARLDLHYRLPIARAGHASFELEIPKHGVVTAASVTAGGETHRLELEHQGAADAAFEAILEQPAGTGNGRRWAVTLGGAFGGELSVEVAAPRAGDVELDVQVDAETCFVSDHRYARVPAAWSHFDRAVPRDRTPDACTRAWDDEAAWIEFPTQEASARPYGDQRIVATAARLDLPHGQFARFEVALARQLTRLAPDLYTVFVIDASRSLTATALETQTKTILSYAQRAGRSRVQVVAYAREARPLLAGWRVAANAQLASTLDGLALANGSNLDAGLMMASTLLASVHGTRRIVVFSDQLTSERVRALTSLNERLPAGTLVHVVALGPGESSVADSISRDDTIMFADLARATEGLAAIARLSNEKTIDASRLVRPIELDHVTLDARGWDALSIEHDATTCTLDGSARLREGQGCTWWGAGRHGGRMKLRGLLWNHPIARDLSPANDPVMLARMLSHESDDTLGAAKHEVDQAAMAINQEWSLLAQWGGAAGYADLLGGGASIGGSSFGSTTHCGFGLGTRTTRVPTVAADTLPEQLERAIARCHLTYKVGVTVELTLNEIVDVGVAAANAADRRCVTEAVWSVPVVLASPASYQKRTLSL